MLVIVVRFFLLFAANHTHKACACVPFSPYQTCETDNGRFGHMERCRCLPCKEEHEWCVPGA